jgi:heme-degrading monooxygenase HmoA
MFARVSRFEGRPENVDQSIQRVRDQVLPALRETEGGKGLIALVDRESGNLLGVTLWESEDAMQASEERADQIRQESLVEGERIAGVERYEVAVFEV